MTAIMCSPVLYCCDGPRCRAEEMGTTVRLPDGWREITRERPGVLGGIEEYVGHNCPQCAPPTNSEKNPADSSVTPRGEYEG